MAEYRGDRGLDMELAVMLWSADLREFPEYDTPYEAPGVPLCKMRKPGGDWEPLPPLSGTYEGMGMVAEALAAKEWIVNIQWRDGELSAVCTAWTGDEPFHRIVNRATNHAPLAVARAAYEALSAAKEANAGG